MSHSPTSPALPMDNVTIIGFDADDTLWVNEPYFQDSTKEFCTLLEDYLSQHHIAQELYKNETVNIELYGYGIKGYILNMIETVLTVSDKTADIAVVEKCLELGKTMLNHPIELLPDVPEVLSSLQGKYTLVVATKGDLLDQERKLARSGLEKYFHHIEIMSEKNPESYRKLLRHLDCQPENFLMIGNSLKSDIIPVLEIGCQAIHIPYHTTWAREVVKGNFSHKNMRKMEAIKQVSELLASP